MSDIPTDGVINELRDWKYYYIVIVRAKYYLKPTAFSTSISIKFTVES